MEFQDIIKRLEGYSKTIHKAIIATSIIEAICVIIIGVASSNVNTNNLTVNKFAIGILLTVAIFYLFLLFIKTFYNTNYPGSITNELKSERQLNQVKRDWERLKTINSFLVDTFQRLNVQTCALNYGDDTHLCDKGIQEGIHNLIEPVIENIYFILDTINTDFTIGIYIENYRSLSELDKLEKGIIVIEDRLGKGYLLTKDLLSQTEAKGEQLWLQTTIRHSLNNYEFINYDYTDGQNNYTVIASPMPYACDEEDVNGVLFIISKRLETLPDEVETNLKIFNRVISNWIYRYNECIYNRQEMQRSQLSTQATTKE